VSEIKPKQIAKALTDDEWIISIEEELHQFTISDVYTLVPKPENKSIIEIRWIFRSWMDKVRW